MRVTASKVGLLPFCQYFARPEAEWVNSSGAAAERGTRFHQAIARYVETGFPGDTAVDIVAEVGIAAAWVDDFGREKLASEVAFAWDPVTDTAERIPAVERDYQAGAGRLCGTADLVAVQRATKTGYIGDWKTGDGSGAAPQLRALALMLARAEDLDSVTVEALEVTPAGVTAICREELDAFALAAVAGELAESLAAVPTAEPKPGPHCGELYCPARATCPAGTSAVAELVPEGALVRKFSTALTGPDHAVWMLDRIRLVEAQCKAIKDAIKDACPEEGWRLEGGSVLREGTRMMARFDKSKALALLAQLHATPEQIRALTYEVEESAGMRVQKPEGAAKPRKRSKAA